MPKRILSFWQRAELLEGEREQSINACLPFYTLISLLFLVFPLFLFSSFSFLVFTYLLWFSPRGCYYHVRDRDRDAPSAVHGKGPLYSVCRSDFTILAFNNLCLVWVSLPITYWIVSHSATITYLCWPCHQTKKTILFVCLSWHSYLLRCGCSLSFYPSWHTLSGPNLSLLPLGGMSSQEDISPKRAWAGTP